MKLEGKIIIQSGEGEIGTFESYHGARTLRAIRARLTRERCNGDRWARAWIEAGPEYVEDTFVDIDGSDMRMILPEDIDE